MPKLIAGKETVKFLAIFDHHQPVLDSFSEGGSRNTQHALPTIVLASVGNSR